MGGLDYTIDGQPVVRRECGEGTGETIYKTEDGRWWQSVQLGDDISGTGITVKQLQRRGGRSDRT